MRKRNSGSIINTSSMGGKMYTPLGSWYHATKHALEGWSDCLRLEVAPFGIDVVVLEPGAIETEFDQPMMKALNKNKENSAYHELIDGMIAATEKSFSKPGAASPSSVISNTVSKIVKSKRPKTRYLVGKYAKPMVFIRQKFGDRVFDKMVMSQVKRMGQ
jgi:short-subunit dehydrogenase